MTINSSLKFPKINFQEDLRFVAKRIIVATMQQNIENQISLNETPLPLLEPATIKSKAKKGLDTRILIATGKLRSDFLVSNNGASGIKITIHPERKEIAKYLQIEGIRTKSSRKFFNFFGISTRMEEDAVSYMKSRIKEILASGKSR